MDRFETLANLYSDFLFGERNYESLMKWAMDCLLNGKNTDDIVLLCSPSDNEETIELTRKILKSVDYLETIEVPTTTLLNKVKASFSLELLPKYITNYKKNDPEDYDGEGQSVTDHFKGKSWDKVEPLGYALTYFTDEAFVYYLPAYLEYIIIHKHPKTDIKSSVFRAFSDVDYWNEKRQGILSYLSDYQKRLILAVLREVAAGSTSYRDECKNIRKRLNIEIGRLI